MRAAILGAVATAAVGLSAGSAPAQFIGGPGYGYGRPVVQSGLSFGFSYGNGFNNGGFGRPVYGFPGYGGGYYGGHRQPYYGGGYRGGYGGYRPPYYGGGYRGGYGGRYRGW